MAIKGEDKAARLAALREEIIRRYDCRPEEGCRNVVFGEGNASARLMLVGEAPGEVEDRIGRPFVGPAGKLLDSVLERAGIERSELWVTNVVKIRPVTRVGKVLRNRPPTTAEVAAWRPVIEAELQVVQPAALVCLGATAASALIHPRFRIGDERGKWLAGPHGSAALATYHPSYPLRLAGASYERVVSIMVEDLIRARERSRGSQ